MKRYVALFSALLVVGLGAGDAFAKKPIRTPGRFGLGLGSGTLANGLSAKYFLSKQDSLQFNLGEFGGGGFEHRWRRFDDGFGLGVDYLFEMPDIVRAGHAFDLAWAVGGGLGVGIDDDDHFDDHDDADFAFAAAFVLGLEFNFIPIPLDIVLEWRPGLLLVPDVDFDAVDFTAHIRVYF